MFMAGVLRRRAVSGKPAMRRPRRHPASAPVNQVVPARDTHAHSGIIDRAGFDHTVDLVAALIKRLDAAAVADLRDFAPPRR